MGSGLGKARPSCSILAHARARTVCKPCWARLLYPLVHMRVRGEGRLGRTRLQLPLASVGTGSGQDQARLQHLMASARIGGGP